MELVHLDSDNVVASQVAAHSARQKRLLDGLKLEIPGTVPEVEVTVGTRKEINHVRKALEHLGPIHGFGLRS